MPITGTHIAYYHTCHRKLWLFHHGINMEHSSDLVAEGRLIEESSYQRRPDSFSQVELEGIKIDFYNHKDKVIHETKKSDKIEKAHEAQVKYYIYRLEQEGITGVSGLIEYPKLRHTAKVTLSEEDRENIVKWIKNIKQITQRDKCPDLIKKRICKRCAYYEFCYTDEEIENQ